MKFSRMIQDAKRAGLADEKKMWMSVEALDDVLEKMEQSHPQEYWDMMRDQHEILFGPHYSDEFAKWDVSQIKYTGRDNQAHEGAYWSKSQLSDATVNRQFPAGTTEDDIFVAYNYFYADTCKELEDTKILDVAYRFFFADEDAPEGKIWRYVRAMRNN